MLEIVAFRIADKIHGIGFDTIMAVDTDAVPLAALLSILERKPWTTYDDINEMERETRILLVSLVCENKGKIEKEMIKKIPNIHAVTYIVNRENIDPTKLFQKELDIKSIYLTTYESVKSFYNDHVIK